LKANKGADDFDFDFYIINCLKKVKAKKVRTQENEKQV
jgi:hypothetical protein